MNKKENLKVDVKTKWSQIPDKVFGGESKYMRRIAITHHQEVGIGVINIWKGGRWYSLANNCTHRLRNRPEWRDSEEDGKKDVDFIMWKQSIVK